MKRCGTKEAIGDEMSYSIIQDATGSGDISAGAPGPVEHVGIGEKFEVATREDAVAPPTDHFGNGASSGQEARERLGWGERFVPPMASRKGRQQFSQICQRILCELDSLELAEYFADGKVTAEGAGVIAEIATLLEAMFDCPFGEGESVKSVAVAIQSQTNNVEWTEQLTVFLRDVMKFLRARYVVNDQTVDEVYQMMNEHGLDQFRGAISDSDVKKRYRLIEQ